MNALLMLITHTLIGFYFVFFGVWNIYHWRPVMEAMIEDKIPHPWLLLPIGIAWQTIAGGLIILGIYIKIAALSLIVFTIISSFIFSPFWKFSGMHRNLAISIFMSNLTLTLSALLLIAYS